VSCVPYETLVALFTGELSGAEVAAAEDHVFTCDRCAEAHVRLARLVDGLRETIPPVISHAQRDRLARAGKRLRVTHVQAGKDAFARFDDSVDMLVHVLHGDLSRAERVDVEIVSSGAPLVVFEHVPFDPAAGEVLIACQKHYAMYPRDTGFRVHAVEGGVRRQVGEYFVEHDWAL
jgi:hypothetical protein